MHSYFLVSCLSVALSCSSCALLFGQPSDDDGSPTKDSGTSDGTAVDANATTDSRAIYDAAIDANLDFCIDNLLIDPSFESSMGGWQCTNCTMQLDNETSVSGLQSLKVCPTQDDSTKDYMSLRIKYSPASPQLPVGSYEFSLQISSLQNFDYKLTIAADPSMSAQEKTLTVSEGWLFTTQSLNVVDNGNPQDALDLVIKSISLPDVDNCIHIDNVCLRKQN